MVLPFLSGSRKKRDQILAVDLGVRTTKAVQLKKQGDTWVLSSFALLDAPIYDKTLSPEALAEHLRAVAQALDAKTKALSLTANVSDALVKNVEIPRMPLDDMRMMLKHNSKNYLQQDLLNHIFDCEALVSPTPEAAKPDGALQKQKMLVAGTKEQWLTDCVSGIKGAGLTPDHVIPAVVSPVNAFELAQPEEFSKEVVALIDIGFKHSTICILQEGQLVLSRVVNIGGDRFTAAVSETMSVSYAEAEGIKVGMASEVESALESVANPLGRELRASIDFFEHQSDRTVSCAYLSGGSTRSEFIVQCLKQELMIEAKTWNPVSFLKLELPPQQAGEIEQVASQLAVAIGAGIAAL